MGRTPEHFYNPKHRRKLKEKQLERSIQKLTEHTINLWKEKHYSLGMIAKVYGCSRQAVKKYLNRRGIDTSYQKFTVNCNYCNGEITRTRVRVRNQKHHFCEYNCYKEFTRTKQYNVDRVQQIEVRRTIRQFFPLKPQHIVHPIDNNPFNTNPNNYLVFKSLSHRTSWMEHGKPKPVWP